MRYVFSVVRFVPKPATDASVNVGAIAGSEQAGDWSVRQVLHLPPAGSFGPRERLDAVVAFFADIRRRVPSSHAPGQAASGLSEAWLADLHRRHRDFIQVSPP
ncbi:MAG TPA: DUF3037 domain-containing protein, partial [Micromonosporaceae bacterium]|nr:DUF3037 domain-containing protein [Micromonosporaceae bacterium]